MSYSIQATWAIIRIAFWFVLLYGYIAPYLFPSLKKLNVFDRIIYSWTGLGGILMPTLYLLVILHLYDFFSITLIIVFIPIIRGLWQHRGNLFELVRQTERKIVLAFVWWIEERRRESWSRLLAKRWSIIKSFRPHFSFTFLVIIISILGGYLRLIPSLSNAAPFSRMWYEHLDKVKNLNLATYFSGYVEPKGMHAVVNLFSTLTQVSPELILHVLGGILSIFIMLMIYKSVLELTNNDRIAGLFAMSLYAFVPTLIFPISLEHQLEANTLIFGLCFAIPTVILFLRFLKGDRGSAPYIWGGVIATGFSNLFLFLLVLAPLLLVMTVTIKNPLKKRLKVLAFVPFIYGMTLLPYFLYSQIIGMSFWDGLRSQLYLTTEYSYYPNILLDIDQLSKIYALAALVIMMILLLFKKRFFILNPATSSVFLFLVVLFSLPYIPELKIGYIWIDTDQLNSFYAYLLAVMLGVFFSFFTLFYQWILKDVFIWQRLKIVTMFLLLIPLLWMQKGIKWNEEIRPIMPNEFFQAYYKIINNRIPYSYAIVGPALDKKLGKNRHFFMTYDYFMDNYGSIDSLYHDVLLVKGEQEGVKTIPPASIFVFVEKPPYHSIDKSILYHSERTMSAVSQWLEAYRRLKGRTVKTFLESDNIVVYEIVNLAEESRISDLLLNMSPKN